MLTNMVHKFLERSGMSTGGSNAPTFPDSLGPTVRVGIFPFRKKI